MARLSYSLGRTINLGNYNSIRIEVSHEIDCNESEVDEKYEQLRAYVRAKLKDEVAELA